MRRPSGFSLAEFVIATTIVAVAASVAIPAATSRRILANEACAVVALRDIASAQARFQAAKVVDVDNDGVGEFGLLRELSGAVGLRTTTDASTQGYVLAPPLLPRAFGRFVFERKRHTWQVLRGGYFFRMLLPGLSGRGVYDAPGTAALFAAVDPELAAATWGCYAWPQQYGRTGNQTFFINQTDEIVATESREYSGGSALNARNAGAAFVAGGYAENITGQLAIGTVGRDGNVWRLVTLNVDERHVVARARWNSHPGWFELRRDEDATSVRERLVIQAAGLRPGRPYEAIVLDRDSPNDADFGTVVADATGRVTYRFDSRADSYPEGVSSLLQLALRPICLTSTADGIVEGTIPEFRDARVAVPTAEHADANEVATIARLREIAAAQTTFQASRAADVDRDGVGEYGLFRELSGATGVRNIADASTQGSVLSPPLLSGAFRVFNTNHEVSRSGYLLHMILPGAAGIGVMEVSGTAALAAALDTDLAEMTWCCYAWPQRYGKTGTRTFFIDQSGDITATDFVSYSGTSAFVAYSAGSAFAAGGALTNITGQVATGTLGRDGHIWRLVPNRPAEHDLVVRGAMTPTAQGSAASGTFVVESRQLTNDTKETIEVTADGLDAGTTYRLVVTDPAGTTSFQVGGGSWRDSHGRLHFPALPEYAPETVPVSVGTVTAFGGGTIDVMSGDTVVLRGVLPEFATIGGAHVPGSSVVFHVAKPLDAAPNHLPRRGSLDVRVTNAPEGTREELTVEVTTYDRDAEPYGVFVVDDLGAATPLGTIAVRGLRGTGTLSLDTARGDVVAGGGLVALSGRTLEVGTPTGFVVLTATLPDVE